MFNPIAFSILVLNCCGILEVRSFSRLSRSVVERSNRWIQQRTRVDASQDDQERAEKFKNRYNEYFDPSIPAPPPPANMTPRQMMAALGTSPRRIVLAITSGTGIALVGNLFGVTSNLLLLFPEDGVEKTTLDTYYPRGNYKRVVSPDVTFIIPKAWVADTSLELAKATARASNLDLQMKRTKTASTMPTLAYGPPGGTGDTNVSVIVGPVPRSLTLDSLLGPPYEAAENLLKSSIAPQGSGRVATLRSAESNPRRSLYQFEYDIIIEKKNKSLRNISLVALKNGKIVTLTVVAPVSSYDGKEQEEQLRKIVDSFHLQ